MSENALLAALEGYAPALPDEAVAYFLQKSGFETDDPRVQKLVGLAAQKFIYDLANDALSHAQTRTSSNSSSSSSSSSAAASEDAQQQTGDKQSKLILTTEDLQAALQNYGMHSNRPAYLANAPPAASAAVKAEQGGKSGVRK